MGILPRDEFTDENYKAYKDFKSNIGTILLTRQSTYNKWNKK
jgi:hypothetical protein